MIKQIKYIPNSEIDVPKWDACIAAAPNSKVYAFSWFLDRAAENWDALVWGDYRFVMPLTFKRKWGITYLFQPTFCQQLGIFPEPSADVAKAFYEAVIQNFRFFNVQLNSANQQIDNLKNVCFSPRKNYLLNLSPNYEKIISSFSNNTNRNIAKAKNNNLTLVEGISLKEYSDFMQQNQAFKIDAVQENKLRNLISIAQYNGAGEIAGVYSMHNQLCAAVFFMRWNNRIIYLNPVSSGEGKELLAMFYLINRLIENNSGRNLLIDFEGSMVPGIARFFEGFGATPEVYLQMTGNNLPFPLRWILKKKR